MSSKPRIAMTQAEYLELKRQAGHLSIAQRLGEIVVVKDEDETFYFKDEKWNMGGNIMTTRDKKWLKEEVRKLNLVDTEFEADGLCYMDGGVSLTQVYDLIDQLDEPEKLSQEWIEKHRYHDGDLDAYFIRAENLENLIVAEPEKAVVPQVVADWYEKEGNRMKWWNWFYKWGGDQGDSRTELEKRAIEWMQDFNEGLFVDIFRYGYEIEKEPLYYVQLLEGKSYLCEEPFGELWFNNAGLLLESSYKGKMRFTEKEIKSINEHYWQFAQPVEEEE